MLRIKFNIPVFVLFQNYLYLNANQLYKMDICDQTDPLVCGNQIADPLLLQTVLLTADNHSKESLHSSVDQMKKLR